MFGPGVDAAIERYLAPERELLAVLQLFRRSQEIIFRYDIKQGPLAFETQIHGRPFSMYNDTVIAYGEDGHEIFRTTVEEPVHVRPEERTNAV
jgi:nitrate reductase beta subunit